MNTKINDTLLLGNQNNFFHDLAAFYPVFFCRVSATPIPLYPEALSRKEKENQLCFHTEVDIAAKGCRKCNSSRERAEGSPLNTTGHKCASTFEVMH